jgi:quercetin dioxygenase-like cupin family protein
MSMQFFEDGYLPTINTTFSFFGGHAETVEPGWRWPTEHHPAFEIMYILDGAQRTVTESAEKIIKAGEMMIIPIGMEHTNYCWGNESMTFLPCISTLTTRQSNICW